MSWFEQILEMMSSAIKANPGPSTGDMVIGGVMLSIISTVVIIGLVQYYNHDKKIKSKLYGKLSDEES